MLAATVRVWCLRHAESENVTGEVAGAVPTAPLTERGRHQAIEAAQTLAGEPIRRVYASTALRARQTARRQPCALPKQGQEGNGGARGGAAGYSESGENGV